MALFPWHDGPNRSTSRIKRTLVIVVQQPQARFPTFLTRLDLLCHNAAVHLLPVRMTCVARAHSDKG